MSTPSERRTLARPALAMVLTLAAIAPAAGQVPVGFPPPPTPVGNPITPDKALLGKTLFWDEQMSSTGTTACGTCHIFAAGGSDPRSRTAAGRHPGPDRIFGTADDIAGSPGVPFSDLQNGYRQHSLFGLDPQVTRRKAPSVINAGYARSLFWDGSAPTTPFVDPTTGAPTLGFYSALESVVRRPPVNDVEMGHLGRSWQHVTTRVAAAKPLAVATNLPQDLASFTANATYPDLFQRAFGTPDVTSARIIMAIATYIRTLVSDQSRFDRVLEGAATFTAQEAQGRVLFDANCLICHGDVHVFSHFNGPQVAPFEFSNTGVRPPFEDLGSGNGSFRIPFLRNVALRTPLFHNGGAQTLGDVVDFYDRGGDFPNGASSFIRPLNLSQGDRDALVAFLDTLTDPRVAAELPPFDRPTLFTESAFVPTFFGTGTAGSGGFVPEAIALEPAHLGNPRYTLGVRRAASQSLALLLWDTVPDLQGTPTAGVGLHLARSVDFTAVTAPRLTSGAGPGQGYVTMTTSIPATASLRGLVLFGQWAVVDGGASSGVAASQGFRVEVF